MWVTVVCCNESVLCDVRQNSATEQAYRPIYNYVKSPTRTCVRARRGMIINYVRTPSPPFSPPLPPAIQFSVYPLAKYVIQLFTFLKHLLQLNLILELCVYLTCQSDSLESERFVAQSALLQIHLGIYSIKNQKIKFNRVIRLHECSTCRKDVICSTWLCGFRIETLTMMPH